MQRVTISMPDGSCDALLWVPESARHAVLWCTDAIGIRPSTVEQAERLVEWGVAVLMPNVYWRQLTSPFIDGSLTGSGAEDDYVQARFANMTAHDFTHTDADAPVWADHLTRHSGLPVFDFIGFCMGGRIGLRTARATGSQCRSVWVYHPGSLVRPDPDSEHLLLPEVSAEVYFGYADDDPSMTAEHQQVLRTTAREAGVRFDDHLHPGAAHGFMMPERPAFNAAAAEYEWRRLADRYRPG